MPALLVGLVILLTVNGARFVTLAVGRDSEADGFMAAVNFAAVFILFLVIVGITGGFPPPDSRPSAATSTAAAK